MGAFAEASRPRFISIFFLAEDSHLHAGPERDIVAGRGDDADFVMAAAVAWAWSHNALDGFAI